jgi:hypothetical protein
LLLAGRRIGDSATILRLGLRAVQDEGRVKCSSNIPSS